MRSFAPALLIAVVAFNLCVIRVSRQHRPAASRLAWLWMGGATGAALLCLGWRPLLRNIRTGSTADCPAFVRYSASARIGRLMSERTASGAGIPSKSTR